MVCIEKKNGFLGQGEKKEKVRERNSKGEKGRNRTLNSKKVK